jgi:hypothetical protein
VDNGHTVSFKTLVELLKHRSILSNICKSTSKRNYKHRAY